MLSLWLTHLSLATANAGILLLASRIGGQRLNFFGAMRIMIAAEFAAFLGTAFFSWLIGIPLGIAVIFILLYRSDEIDSVWPHCAALTLLIGATGILLWIIASPFLLRFLQGLFVVRSRAVG